jgi:hypothetical protein
LTVTQQIYQVLESKAFPEKSPYGLWVLPDGDFITVRYGGHYDVAMNWIASNPSMEGRYSQISDRMEYLPKFMLYIGSVRIAQAYYQGDSTYKLEYSAKRVSAKALKTARDIACHYNFSTDEVQVSAEPL